MVEGGEAEGISTTMKIVAILMIIIVVAASVIVYRFFAPPRFEVSGILPVNGQDEVDVYGPIVIDFTADVDPDSILAEVVIEPHIVGAWGVNGSRATYVVGNRMDSYTQYNLTLTGDLLAADGRLLDEPFFFSFTTGNTSARVVETGVTAQIEFAAMTTDGLVFATNKKDIYDDDVNWPKSPYFIRAEGAKWAKLRKYPIIIGKEDEFPAFEQKLLGLHIGDQVKFNLSANETFGQHNASLVRTLPFDDAVPVTETMDNSTASFAFTGNLTVGARGVHPQWAWNITLTATGNDEITIRNEPFVGLVSQPYGWDTEVTAINATVISVRHHVNATHQYQVFPIEGYFPERSFMAMEVNLTAEYVVMDENWPPGIVGEETAWIMWVCDIKQTW